MPDNVARENTPVSRDAAAASRQQLGRNGERLAATWLEARGLVIVERNWRCPYGELDLIARHGEEWVFIEVKTRRGTRMGAPEEAVTRGKRRRLILSAQAYLSAQGAEQQSYRIDVIAVELTPAGVVAGIRHYPRSIEMEEPGPYAGYD